MITIGENETKYVYLTLGENQTLVGTTLSTVYYLFEAENNDTQYKTQWLSEDESTNQNRYNKFLFNNTGTFSLNSEFSLPVGTYDYRCYETLLTDLNTDNATSVLETGLMRVTGVASTTFNGYSDNDNDTNYTYYE